MSERLPLTLGRFAMDLARNGIPEAILVDTKQRVLDTLGNMIAAAWSEPAAATLGVASAWGGAPESTVVGSKMRLPAPSAALVNAALAHGAEFDGTHFPSNIRPSASVIPAALALGEARHASGDQTLRAIAAAEEICVRLSLADPGSAASDPPGYTGGRIATPALGAAVVGTLLLGLDAKKVARGLEIAENMSSGFPEREGRPAEPFAFGWAAHTGVTAAHLAGRAMLGLADKRDSVDVYPPSSLWSNADNVVSSLGERWESRRILIKPYPTYYGTYPGIEAAIALRSEGLDPINVATIDVGMAAPLLRTTAQPFKAKTHPGTSFDARFSAPYTVAAALTGESFGVQPADFTDSAIRDPGRLRLAALVTCQADEEATKAYPDDVGGVIRVSLKDGSRRDKRIRSSRGGPRRPLVENEVNAKFRQNASRQMSTSHAKRIEDLVADMDRLDDVGSIAQSLGSAQS